jgi:hypothetical protein
MAAYAGTSIKHTAAVRGCARIRLRSACDTKGKNWPRQNTPKECEGVFMQDWDQQQQRLALGAQTEAATAQQTTCRQRQVEAATFGPPQL